MKVVNLIGGPGIGKSTLAASLFAHAKRIGRNVELVTEYAKDMVWEDRMNILHDQLYILAKQSRRLHRLRDHVEYVITDSPLLLGPHYAVPGYFTAFGPMVLEVFRSYDNINLFLSRPSKENYSEIGRMQTYEEACEIDDSLAGLLNGIDEPYIVVNSAQTPECIWDHIKGE